LADTEVKVTISELEAAANEIVTAAVAFADWMQKRGVLLPLQPQDE